MRVPANLDYRMRYLFPRTRATYMRFNHRGRGQSLFQRVGMRKKVLYWSGRS